MTRLVRSILVARGMRSTRALTSERGFLEVLKRDGTEAMKALLLPPWNAGGCCLRSRG